MSLTITAPTGTSSSASAKSCYDYERDRKYPGDKIRESKNWKYFVDVYEMTKDYPMFDEEIFMDSVFRNIRGGMRIFPAQLRTKKAITNYLDYRLRLKMSDRVSNQKKMMIDMSTSYKFIKRQLKKENLTSDDLYHYFNDVKDNNVVSMGLLACIQEMISPFYLGISKSFEIAYRNADQDIQDEIMSANRLENIRALVKLKTPVFSFAKKIFGDDIVD